jgi:hypothetical protein
MNKSELFTIKQASEWATELLSKKVTPSNISYLIQYGKIRKIRNNGIVAVDKQELLNYYSSFLNHRQISWKSQLGEDLNWHLSFEQYKEAETTKHVHRLHPYKGKFIPQLVEYFLDEHSDEFKKEVYFKKGDVILDPFCGSGTTLVQASELGIHAIGIDISAFNSLISNAKITRYDFTDIYKEIQKITKALKQFIANSNTYQFENKLLKELSLFNNKYFPVPDYKYKIKRKEINEKEYGFQKEREFIFIYQKLIGEYGIVLKNENENTFLHKWYLNPVKKEIDYVFNLIKEIENVKTKKIISVILSRTIRSCRATTHADLATLKEPVLAAYYCAKHGKVCKPLFSILKWWEHYAQDTISRLIQFDKLRTETHQICLTGDARTIDILQTLETKYSEFADLVKHQKINGIFSSPPYVGLIDYHEQHAYAYDLFGFERNDDLEIGPLSKGQKKEAQENYILGISEALINCKRYLTDDCNVFLVANDKFNLYPSIAENAKLCTVNTFKRPVLNRSEKDKGAYSETIFHLKNK